MNIAGLIVSCQAGAGHPLRDTATIVRLARAAETGGAAAIRCGGVGGVEDVAAVVRAVDLPVIGLTKDGQHGVYITPTVAAAQAVVRAGADIVATDATARSRPDGATLADTVHVVHEARRLLLADVSTVEEGLAAVAAGADLVATTLSGYTPTSPRAAGPDLALVAALRAALPAGFPLLAEGRYHTPEVAAAALRLGATSVVVGTAITDPAFLTARFATIVSGQGRVAPGQLG
ncbi:MAG TPA: putative N-acetylmannosamine-6-phosphate 2-epimerase [Pseudonocardiaceae bacterium]|nr:putative N-acetylmannosamine-6-phosphate 2-epimerase [Pseudonocardiaceae bacterium]